MNVHTYSYAYISLEPGSARSAFFRYVLIGGASELTVASELTKTKP